MKTSQVSAAVQAARRHAYTAALLLLSLPTFAWSADPPAVHPGRAMIDAYFRDQTRRVADACLADVKTREEWEKRRPEMRREFLEMLGLWPLPERTDLRPVVTGRVEADKFVIEKLHFQSSPGLYVTANLYVPRAVPGRLPAVLYVCGHGPSVIDGVSYGNKVTYQHHGAWLAEHGYVCLIVDTLQMGEIEGIHHGTHPGKKLNYWWWHTLGYTPAGIECWNGMRALDYLETRPEVDPQRLAVTGRSGGGATSWWVGAADDRVRCIIPVAGIADLHAHVVEGLSPRLRSGVIAGHCDCMYFVNTYRWDFALVAALCAPRPLLLGNSDADDIFPVPGYRRLADKVRPIYELLGAGDKFALLETAGPHKDTPELRQGAFQWLNRWLKGDPAPVTVTDWTKLPPPQLKVFDRLPGDAINATVHESFIKPARFVLPPEPEKARAWWGEQTKELRLALREKVFRGWPEQPPPLTLRPAGDVKQDGLRVRAFDFTSEEAIDLRLWLVTAEKVEKPSLTVLTAVDDEGWREFLAELGPAFRDVLPAGAAPPRDEGKFTQLRKTLELNPWAFATVAPRGFGPTRWAEPGSADDSNIRRRFVLLGQTLDGQRVWDVRRGLEVLRQVPDLKGVPLWLQGKKELAGVGLYAALFEPDVARLDLWDLPASHRQGPTLLNVRRHLDLPQALALALPKQVRLYVRDEAGARAWAWTEQLQKALGQDSLKIRRVGN